MAYARNGGMEKSQMQQQCGTWKLSQEIGRGAYGVVYMAIGPGGERAAVKVCRRDAVDDERYERELRGAKLYRAIPPQVGLVRMRELVEEDWGFYTVMDLADDEFGGSQEPSSGYRPKTLARVIEGEKALPLKECVTLALSLANGLCALQRHHLLHRDIKPGNVIYVKGQPVLSDPGLVVEESNAVSTVGTPGYVPPEKKFTDAASDIYSLGLTLKAASFGRQVEDLDKGPSMEADTGAALFPAWWRILNKATDPTPSRRYQSAKALIKDIRLLDIRIFFASRKSWKRRIVVSFLKLILVVSVFVVVFFVFRLANEGNMPVEDAINEPVKGDAINEPVKGDAINEPVKGDAINEPVKGDAINEPVKGNAINEPVKGNAGNAIKEPVKKNTIKEPAKEDTIEEPVKKHEEGYFGNALDDRFLYQLKMLKFIRETNDWLEEAVNRSMSAYTLSRWLSKELSRKIEKTIEGNEGEKLSQVQTELLELKEKLREISVKICILKFEHEDSLKKKGGPTRSDIEEKLQTALKLIKEGDAFQKQTWKIGTVIHGKEWKPPNQLLHKTPDGLMDAISIQDEAEKRIKSS